MGWKTVYKIDQKTLAEWWNSGVPSPWNVLVMYDFGDHKAIGVDNNINGSRMTDFIPLPQATGIFGFGGGRIRIRMVYDIWSGTMSQKPGYVYIGLCYYRERVSVGSCEATLHEINQDNLFAVVERIVEINGKHVMVFINGTKVDEFDLNDIPDAVKVIMYASYTYPSGMKHTSFNVSSEHSSLKPKAIEPYALEFLIAIREFEIQYYDVMEEMFNMFMGMFWILLPVIMIATIVSVIGKKRV